VPVVRLVVTIRCEPEVGSDKVDPVLDRFDPSPVKDVAVIIPLAFTLVVCRYFVVEIPPEFRFPMKELPFDINPRAVPKPVLFIVLTSN